MTMSLSYNSQTRLTSGFLGFVKSGNKNLLSSILSSKTDARHPLMLPLLCFNNFLHLMRKETRWQSQERSLIARLIHKAAQTSYLDSVDFPSIHTRLIDSHVILTSAMGPFVEISSTRLKTQLGNTNEMLSPESRADSYFVEKTDELLRCMDMIDTTARDLIYLRQRISIRIDILLKVVSCRQNIRQV